MKVKQEGKARTKFAWLPRKRKIKLGIAIVIVIGLWFAWKQISSPVTGKTVVTDASASIRAKGKTNKTPRATDIENNYYMLKLPAGYRVQATNESVSGLLYQQTLVKPSTMGSVVISIAVKNSPEGGFSGDPSYQMRVKNSARYTMNTESIGGQNVVLASDAQAGAITAFIANGGRMATVSASSGVSSPTGDNNEAQRQALQPVLEAWRWR